MKKLLVILSMFALITACGSGGGGNSSGASFNVAGCQPTSVSQISQTLGLSSQEESAANAELQSTFNNYRLWYCTGASESALDSYGDSFGIYDGIDAIFGYPYYWWETGNEGWGYTEVDSGEYLVLWGNW